MGFGEVGEGGGGMGLHEGGGEWREVGRHAYQRSVCPVVVAEGRLVPARAPFSYCDYISDCAYSAYNNNG